MFDPKLKNQRFHASSNHIVGDCPFCQKTNHFYMNAATGAFDCKVCGIVGGSFDSFKRLLKKELGIELISEENLIVKRDKNFNIKKVNSNLLNDEAVEKKIEETEVEEVELPQSCLKITKQDTPQAYWYIRKRGYGKKHIEKYKLHFCQSDYYFHRIIIPVIMYGKVYGFLGRWLPFDGIESDKKYKNKAGTPFRFLLWNYDNLRSDVPVVICEGVFSAMRVGVNMTCTFGKKISDEQIILLKKKNIERVIIAFDSDAKYEATKMAQKMLEEDFKVRLFLLKAGDPDDIRKPFLYEDVLKRSVVFAPKRFAFKELHTFVQK